MQDESKTGGTARASLSDCLVALARRHRIPGLESGVAGGELEASERERVTALRTARHYGLRCRRLTTVWTDLPRQAVRLPAIVSFRDGSCLILAETRTVDGTAVAVLEHPGFVGRYPLIVDRIRFEQVWTGELILVAAPAGGDVDTAPFGWRTVAALALREPRLMRDGLAATLALAALAVVPILFVELMLLRVLPTKGDPSLLVLVAGVGVAAVMEAVFRGVRAFLSARLAARIQARLATLLFDRLLRLPVTTVEALPVGEILHRMEGLESIGALLAVLLPRLTLDGAVLAVVLPLMAYLDPWLTLAVTALGAATAMGLVALRPALRRAATRTAEAAGRRGAFLHQTLGRIGVIKGLALGTAQITHWDRLTAALGKAHLAEARRDDGLRALGLTAGRILVLGTLALGLALPALSGGAAAIAPLIAVVLLVQRLADPLAALPALLRAEAAATVAVARLARLANQPGEPGGKPTSPDVSGGAIAFERVGFSYPVAMAPALRGVSFAIADGTMVGLMGRSGAGKTTIARLLQRLHIAQHGIVRIDGMDIRDLDPDRLRRAVVTVTQTSALFAGTIRDTIIAAKPDATFEEMSQAARCAGADEFIERLPRGYETRLHEGAPSLSAGQRQRLALARALITTPKILILDEALSALDAEIEAVVDANLRAARRGLTTIIVSHRLAALMTADVILVMADGALRDMGSHAELLERCEPYATAWRRQQGTIEGDASLATEPLLALS